MLRRTILNVNNTRSIPKHWRGITDDKSTKYPSLLLNRQRVRWNSSDGVESPSDDEHTKKRKQPKLKSYIEMKLRRLNMKKDKLTEDSGSRTSQKCQKIIAEIFKEDIKKEENKASDVNKDTNPPKTGHDFNLKAVSNNNEEERKLTQKIEEIKEVPIVEAQHEEEFNTTPKTLNIIRCRPQMFPGGYTNVDKAYDDLASQCLKAAPTQIDDALLDGMNKLLYESIKKKDPFTVLKKEKKKPAMNRNEPSIPLLKEHSIPHPAAYLFDHVNFNNNEEKQTEDLAADTLSPDSHTFVFDFKNVSSDVLNESANTAEAQPELVHVDSKDKNKPKPYEKELSKEKSDVGHTKFTESLLKEDMIPHPSIYLFNNLKADKENEHLGVMVGDAATIDSQSANKSTKDSKIPFPYAEDTSLHGMTVNVSTTDVAVNKRSKESKSSAVERIACTQPAQEQDEIPHQGLYFYDHVNFKSEKENELLKDENVVIEDTKSVKKETIEMLQEDNTPLPEKYVFNHVNFITDNKKELMDALMAIEDVVIKDIKSAKKGATESLKEDTLPRLATNMFDHVYFKKELSDFRVQNITKDSKSVKQESKELSNEEALSYAQDTSMKEIDLSTSTAFLIRKEQLIKSIKESSDGLNKNSTPETEADTFNKTEKDADIKHHAHPLSSHNPKNDWLSLTVKNKSELGLPTTMFSETFKPVDQKFKKDEVKSQKIKRIMPRKVTKCSAILVKRTRPLTDPIEHTCAYNFKHKIFNKNGSFGHLNLKTFLDHSKHYSTKYLKYDKKIESGGTPDLRLFSSLLNCTFPNLKKDKSHNFEQSTAQSFINSATSHESSELVKPKKAEAPILKPVSFTSLHNTNVKFTNRYGKRYKSSETEGKDEPVRVIIRENKNPNEKLDKKTLSPTLYTVKKYLEPTYRYTPVMTNVDYFSRNEKKDLNIKSESKNDPEKTEGVRTDETKRPTVAQNKLHRVKEILTKRQPSILNVSNQVDSEKLKDLKLQPISFTTPVMSNENYLKYYAINYKSNENQLKDRPVATATDTKEQPAILSQTNKGLREVFSDNTYANPKQVAKSDVCEESALKPLNLNAPENLNQGYLNYQSTGNETFVTRAQPKTKTKLHNVSKGVSEQKTPSLGTPNEGSERVDDLKLETITFTAPIMPHERNLEHYDINYGENENQFLLKPLIRKILPKSKEQQVPHSKLRKVPEGISIQRTQFSSLNNSNQVFGSEKVGEPKVKPITFTTPVISNVHQSVINYKNEEKIKKEPVVRAPDSKEHPVISRRTNKDSREVFSDNTLTNQKPVVRSEFQEEEKLGLHFNSSRILDQSHVNYQTATDNETSRFRAQSETKTKLNSVSEQVSAQKTPSLSTPNQLGYEKVDDIKLEPVTFTTPVMSHEKNQKHFEINFRENENQVPVETPVKTMSPEPKEQQVPHSKLRKVPERISMQRTQSSSLNTSNQVIGSEKLGESELKPITFTTPVMSNVDNVHRSAMNNKITNKELQYKPVVNVTYTREQPVMSREIKKDLRNISAKTSTATPTHVARSEIPEESTLKTSNMPNEDFVHYQSTNSETKDDPVASVFISESKEPVAIPKQNNDSENVHTYHDPKSINLVKKISSHPVKKHKQKTKVPQNLWKDIVYTDEKILPKEQVYKLKSDSLKPVKPPYNQKLDDLTFEPPDVRFDQPEINPPPARSPTAPEHTAAKTLLVSAEIESDQVQKTNKLDHLLKLPLPDDKEINEKPKYETLYFTREDQNSNTVLKIEVDNQTAAIPNDFKNAKEIIIKVSNHDVCNKTTSKTNSIIVQEFRVITHDKIQSYQAVETDDILQNHAVANDSKSEQSLMTTNAQEQAAENSSNNAFPSSSHVNKLEKNMENIEQSVKINDTYLMQLIKKLRRKRRVARFLDGYNKHKVEYAECGRIDRPKCPPQQCPPRLRCPKRPKKKKYFNRSSCKPRSKQSDCPKTTCPKKAPTCKSKSRSSVCRPHVDNPPPKSSCARFTAIDPSLDNTALIDLKSPEIHDLETLFNFAKYITKTFKLHLNNEIERKFVNKFWNYKNFDPWVPIPSYEKPKKVHRIKVPKHPTKPGQQQLPPPEKGPCLPRSKTFPKLTFALPDLMFVTRKS